MVAVLGITVFMDDGSGVQPSRETLRAYWRVPGGIAEYTRRGRAMAAAGTMRYHPFRDVSKNAIRIHTGESVDSSRSRSE